MRLSGERGSPAISRFVPRSAGKEPDNAIADAVDTEGIAACHAVHVYARDGVHQPALDIRQPPFETGAFERIAGYATVIISIADQNPALGPLACDVASNASRWAGRLLNSCSRPFSEDFRGAKRAVDARRRSAVTLPRPTSSHWLTLDLRSVTDPGSRGVNDRPQPRRDGLSRWRNA